MDVTQSPVCKEVLILSGVSILNFSDFRNLFSELKSRICLHLLLGFGTNKSRLKKARDEYFFTFSIACFCVSACNSSIR